LLLEIERDLPPLFRQVKSKFNACVLAVHSILF
jgi:hypothetical protein